MTKKKKGISLIVSLIVTMGQVLRTIMMLHKHIVVEVGVKIETDIQILDNVAEVGVKIETDIRILDDVVEVGVKIETDIQILDDVVEVGVKIEKYTAKIEGDGMIIDKPRW
jgi:CRISPR/Cas system-associated protein Cas7 (RAMP superfamily)